ncbi:MAG: nodulation protein NfeD [Deltaproteobacteria bacterium]|nr:nodulation protein NfeD [Deltaproteobacteria bacterium]
METRRIKSGFWLSFCLLAVLAAAIVSGMDVQAQDPETKASPAAKIYVMRLEGIISPATAGFLETSIEKAHKAGAQALLVELDTPGGLGQSMRTMVKAILNAPLPIIIFVSPPGAQAASAGVMITMAADVAVMAPGTNIGAAHPVTAEGKDIQGEMAKKVVNDMVALIQGIATERDRNIEWAKKAVTESVSASATEAVEIKVVDMMAEGRADLLKKIDGRHIKRQGLDVTLRTENVEVVEIEEGLRDRILKALANPNIAYILMMLGLAGLYFELSNPGAILPGVMGGLFLILAFYAFQTLPVNFAGVLLIILGIIFFILEIKVTSFGMLSVGGLLSLTLGSLMLFKGPEDYLRVSLSVVLPTTLVIGGFFIVVTSLVIKARVSPPLTGESALVGLTGPVKEWETDHGKVFVHGEWWRAFGEEGLEPGDKIEVVEVDNLNLRVKKTEIANG